MKPIHSRILILSLLLFSAGCATQYRRALQDYRQTQTTPFFEKTMNWLSSTEKITGASPTIPDVLPLSRVNSATEDKFLTLASEIFNTQPEVLKPRLDRISQEEKIRRILAKRVDWKDLSLAVAVYNPAVIAAKERWRATLSQYDQADYLEGLITEYRTFTRYLKVETGKPLQKRMMQSFFPYPSVISLKGELVREQVRLAEYDWQRTLRDRIVDAGIVFYSYQYLYRAESTTRDNVSLIANMLQIVEERYRTGATSQADLIKVQTELERQRNMLEDIQSRQRARAAQLNTLLGRPGREALGPPGNQDKPDVKNLTLDELIDIGKQHRQEIKSQESKLGRIEVAIRMGEVMNRPLASQGYSQLERGMTPDASVGESRLPYGLRAKATDRPAYAQAEAYLREMRERLQAARSMLEQIIADTWGMAQSLMEELDIARRKVSLIDSIVLPQNQSTYDAVRSGYQAGSASFLDLLDAERELIRARLESDDAHRVRNQAVLRLATVAGQIL